MGKFSGVLFATDLDATLLDRKGGLSKENEQAIRYFMDNGGLFAPITGRAPQAFEKPRAFLPFNAPAVLLNGSVIYDYQKSQLLFERDMAPESMAVCAEVLKVFPEVGVESYRIDGVSAVNPNWVTHFHFDYVGIKEVTYVDSVERMKAPWLKVIFTQDHDYLVRVRDYMEPRYSDRFEVVFSNPRLLEMQGLGMNKARGLETLQNLLGIAPENLYCAGDQHNDLPMMSKCVSFAPENAVEEVKAAAAHIVSDCDSHAIRDAIDILDKKYA